MDWVVYPECLDISVTVENDFTVPHPVWPVGAFFICFIIGGLLGALIAKFCLRDYQRKRQQDEEEATLIAQGIPLHMRGKARTAALSPMLVTENTMVAPSTDSPGGSRADAVTPSNILVRETNPGLSDALIMSTGDGALAEIASQDLKDILNLEDFLRQERIDSFIDLLSALLYKLVSGEKLEQESAEQIASDVRTRCDEIVDNAKNEELAEAERLKMKPELQKNEAALQTEIEALHPKYVSRMNSELSEVERDVPRQLGAYATLTDDDIEALMTKLTHQLTTREKKFADESYRQIQMLEEKLARRRELVEQNRLRKEAEAELIAAKVKGQSNSLDVLVNDEKMTASQKDEILREYEKDLLRIEANHSEERAEQERQLHEKLRKQRQTKLKKLDAQLKKEKAAQTKKLNRSTSTQDSDAYQEFVRSQREECEKAIAELDAKEAEQLNDLLVKLEPQYQDEFTQVDEKFAENLQNIGRIDLADVDKIIKIHQLEMKEFERNRTNEQKSAAAKLEQKLAERRKARQAIQEQEAAAFRKLRAQQEDLVIQVVKSQADITEDAAKRIMEEHNKNMTALNTQLTLSKVRQEKQLEERIAQRRARLAEREQQEETRKLEEDDRSEKAALKAKQEIEEEKKKIKQEHAAALEALRERLAAETREALKVQEQHISQLIGQLEVGKARRRNILQKQDKLIQELENQLANKVGDAGITPGVTTTNELLQKHYGQVANLTETLNTTRERQEGILQEKLEKKRLEREVEIKAQMRLEAQQEQERQRVKGAGVASNILLDMMLQQRHEKALADLEQEMKVEMQRARDTMNEQLNAEMMAALSDEGKTFMATLAANSGLSNEDLTDAMKNAASSIQANDQVVKKLAKEMKVRVKTAKGERLRPS